MNKEQKQMWKKLTEPHRQKRKFEQEYEALFYTSKGTVKAIENLGKAMTNAFKTRQYK